MSKAMHDTDYKQRDVIQLWTTGCSCEWKTAVY